MLKLLEAKDLDYDAIVRYKKSFKSNIKDMTFDLLRVGELSRDKYLEFLSEKGFIHFFFLVDDLDPNYIIGNGSIINCEFFDINEYDYGLISYAIRPDERTKHYGTYLLKLLLEQSKMMGISEISISCLKSNIGSKKIIEHNGGNFKKEFYADDYKSYCLQYIVNLKK